MPAFTAKYEIIPHNNPPSCPHGPTILFSQPAKSKKFFACAAYRDRKGCPFYLEFQDFNHKKQTPRNRNQDKSQKVKKVCSNSRLKRILLLPSKKRRFCIDCATLFLPEDSGSHAKHKIKKGIPLSFIRYPITNLLSSKTVDKREAQYRFNRECMTFLRQMLKDHEITNVICLGTPSLHESIQAKKGSPPQKSILLDIDKRIGQFYPKSKFVWFNMFNNYCLEGSIGNKKLQKFLESADPKHLAIVVDPPFGGLIELLAKTIKELLESIKSIHNEDEPEMSVKIVLMLPNFLKKLVDNSLPIMKITDYKVRYLNHTKFSKGSSPVRIFTNIPLEKFILPESEGYRHCDKCKRSVPSEAFHCRVCQDCVTFNGKASVHCNHCSRCVKPTWVHCTKCGRCYPADHSHQNQQTETGKMLQKV